MSSKRKRQQMSATYCRAYLVTLGLLLGGGGAAFALLARGSVSGSALGLALLVGIVGVALLAFGFWGPSRRMESWAEAASGHEVALVLMVLAYPVYLLMAPLYARK
ncbi:MULTISPECIES: hypothetical protein [Xanthomonas]|uniref:Transmembrane protein n=1 Tax=Xanthomonas euroxanthea TaxID=2259622 RepID=A0A381LT33_9XANT|nr:MULTISPECIES: hypothetical protein [Xanthomonas]PPT31976.1 hypothetical protein XaCFBP7622_07905 [Xanthomonas arboricola]SYZ53681.1 hypothetical protein CPBF367_17570 [Xanthomonas arboricola pv. juglandis]CAD1793930.1 hypothetical protein XSP_002805 [Xanthomonas euroxanthea]CAE1137572.1 hypothetical protein XTG_002787 [Xanthomonas euroxanthea]SUZ29279.1 hypothetical protein CPBF424_31170 [Xanthomonas euroxanthea]